MASWMEEGGVAVTGRRRWRAASTRWRSSSKKAGGVIAGESGGGPVSMLPRKGAAVLRPYGENCGGGQKEPASEGGRYKEQGSRGFGLRFGVEGFGYYFAVGFSEEDFHFAFGFFELFL